MTEIQIAALYAVRIKDGEMTKIEAVMYYRNRHKCEYIEALEAINFAIGDLNEFGSTWSVLTEIDVFATL